MSQTDVLECTAIPTIIGQSSSSHLNKITQYCAKKREGQTKEERSEIELEIFNKIIDVLRGIDDYDVLENLVDTTTTEATEENINQIVMTGTGNIATIGVEGGGFIDEEIMVIDMPGLDGRDYNDHDNPLYQEMVQRADFIFFVQSSTSAINEATSKFLENLLANKLTNVPLRLIHNIHESLYYVKDELTTAMVDRQVGAGVKFIKDRFGITGDFENYKLNFAKIYNGLMCVDHIKDSFRMDIDMALKEYECLENEMVKRLKEDRQNIKDRNSITKANAYIALAIDELKKIDNEIVYQLKAFEAIGIKQKELRQQLIDTGTSYYELSEYISNLLRENLVEATLASTIERLVGEKVAHAERTTGKKLKESINALAISFNEISCVGVGSHFRMQLLNKVQKLFSESYNAIFTEIVEFVKQYENAVFTIDDTIKVDLVPNALALFQPRYFNIREKMTVGGVDIFIDKKYDYNENKEYLIEFKNASLSTIDMKIEDYRFAVRSAMAEVKSALLNKILAQVDQRFTHLDKQMSSRKELLNRQLLLMKDMVKKLQGHEN